MTEQQKSTMIDDVKNNSTLEPNQPKNRIIIKLLLFTLVVAVLGWIAFGLWKTYQQPKVVTIQGRVEANTVHVSTKIPSRIEKIYVKEGQSVKEGQLLVKLISPEIEAKKQQAEAMLQSARALQSTAERGSQPENIETLYANWQSTLAQAELAQKTYERGEYLYQEGVISRQRRDEMLAAKKSSHQISEAAYQQYARAKRGSTNEQKSTADAQVKIAEAAVQEVKALDAETTLHAPTNGIVSKIYGEPSELIAMAVPVVSLLQQDYWVSLNVREDQYAQFYQQKSLNGYIPALNKNATFTVKNIEAEGDFATIKTTRQTGGYDIRSFKVHLVPNPAINDLKVGMSVTFDVQEQP